MKTFRVMAQLRIDCMRIMEADSEQDAIDQCVNIGPNEWIEGFTVEAESVDELDAIEIKPPKTKRKMHS